MRQSTLDGVPENGIHVAILMDGNGRWAAARDWPRSVGHRAGVEAVRRVVDAAPALGIRTLTLFAFSADNWRRPADEVGSLFGLLETYLYREALSAPSHDRRIRVMGRRDRLPAALLSAIETVEAATANGRKLDVRVAIDYSAREAILRASCWMVSSTEVSQKEFARRLGQVTNGDEPVPDVDLIIRTGGEKRLSDFLLWESAYAELVFTPRMWPDFDADDLDAAVQEFYSRNRRFGGAPVEATTSFA